MKHIIIISLLGTLMTLALVSAQGSQNETTPASSGDEPGEESDKTPGKDGKTGENELENSNSTLLTGTNGIGSSGGLLCYSCYNYLLDQKDTPHEALPSCGMAYGSTPETENVTCPGECMIQFYRGPPALKVDKHKTLIYIMKTCADEVKRNGTPNKDGCVLERNTRFAKELSVCICNTDLCNDDELLPEEFEYFRPPKEERPKSWSKGSYEEVAGSTLIVGNVAQILVVVSVTVWCEF